MMGRLTDDQGKFFYDFDLNDHVPTDHLLRGIDEVLDLGWLRRELRPFYSPMGRPSVDPELMKANKRVQFGYGLNYLIDNDNAVIVDVEATPARNYDEVAATKTMIERTRQRLRLKPGRLAADTAYGTGRMLGWLRENVAQCVSVAPASARIDRSCDAPP